MENHDPTTCHSFHHRNFLLGQVQHHEEKPSTTLEYNQPHNNPNRKRRRFLSPTNCSSSGGFWSWKALFGHMRCHPERQWRGIKPPPNIRPRQHNHVVDDESSPRKSIKLLSDTIMIDEDHEVAACLLQLANGSSKPDDIVNHEEPPDDENVVKDMRNVAVASQDNQTCSSSGGGVIKDNRFECSGFKKVFGSHQALGGHRASHKNVKGCFASASGSGSWLTQTARKAHNNDDIANLDLNFPTPVKVISIEDQYDSSSSYSSTYSGSALDLRLKL
ncbi:unnamed protein product [Withania somnifera]